MEALVLVRGLLPDLPVRPGTIMHGRVVDPQTMLLEGVPISAQLPAGVAPGDVLRLSVQEAAAERLHLHVEGKVELPAQQAQAQQVQQSSQASAAQQAQAQALAVPLPGGAMVQVLPDGSGAGGGGARRGGAAVTVRFDSPTLGRLDVRLDRHAAAVHVSAGEPADRVRAAAAELRLTLSAVLGHPVAVTVHPRGRTLDASA
ncbi:hypothetical protein [Conexibacter sp. SYSU D00693]|uniref:hypothetical protein n=1 Tax=Conexibacter sp. SYSU D00693 TaxID=2812560 RepID=UPI00196B071D|nr:hypothetical protein [Conexibacter sp. SYSU D00693]